MNIFLDVRFYQRSGIGRYIEGLYKSILDNKPDIKIIAAGDINLLSASFFKPQVIIPYNPPIYSFSEQIKGSILVKRFKNKVDVFHIPHYNAPWFLPENSVVTIHDMTQFLFPEFFGRLKPIVAAIVLKNILKKSGRVIVDSESTKKDLTNHYPEFTDKVKVIYPGISNSFKPLPEDELIAFKNGKGVDKYILYVGNRKPTKNVKRLIEVFFIIRNEYRSLKLIIVGEKFSDVDEIDTRIMELGLKDDIIEVSKVSDEELNKYYCGAELLVHPSLYEGFGFTPLEAFACGIPVAVSKASSLPEICGEAAVYFDPYSLNDIVKKIKMLLEDNGLRKALLEKGFNRASYFTWKRCAEETLKVFEEVKGL